MPRWWNDTVTVYHAEEREENGRAVTVWQRSVYTGCFFGTQDARELSGNTLSMASGYTVRIPHKGLALQLAPGDIAVRGEVYDCVRDEAGCRPSDLLARYGADCFTVRTVSDNTKMQRLAHYKLTGV